MRRTNEALESIDTALSLDPTIALEEEFARPYADRANRRYRGRDLEGALHDLTQALRLDSEDTQIRFFRGRILFELGRYPESIEDFEEIARLDPEFKLESKYFAAYAERARQRFNNGDMESALSDFEKSLIADPKLAQDPLYLRALQWKLDRTLASKQSEEAVKIFERALSMGLQLRVGPALTSAYYDAGKKRFEASDWKGSIKNLTQALKYRPDNMDALYMRACAARNNADLGDALRDFEKVLQMDPNRGEQVQPEIQKIKEILG
jgi:tetratricopeptide (TPR) repeat protein